MGDEATAQHGDARQRLAAVVERGPLVTVLLAAFYLAVIFGHGCMAR